MIPTAKDSKNKPQTGRIRSLKGGTTVIYKDFPEFSLSKHLQTIKSLNKAVEGLLRRKEFSDEDFMLLRLVDEEIGMMQMEVRDL